MKEIQKLYEQYQEPMFRMGLYHMISKGYEHFSDELVAEAKKAVRENETEMAAIGKTPVMTVSFQDGIIDCAAALSRFQITDILRFVKHYLFFEGDDKVGIRCKECNKELTEDATLVNDGYVDSFYICNVCHEYCLEDGSVILCDTCGAYYTPNHCLKNGEETCPYCSD